MLIIPFFWGSYNNGKNESGTKAIGNYLMFRYNSVQYISNVTVSTVLNGYNTFWVIVTIIIGFFTLCFLSALYWFYYF